jgi:hypothetical protein
MSPFVDINFEIISGLFVESARGPKRHRQETPPPDPPGFSTVYYRPNCRHRRLGVVWSTGTSRGCQSLRNKITTLRSRPQTGFNRSSPLRRIYDSTDLIKPVDYVESTASTELCLLHHFFYCRFVRAFANKNDTLNGKCLKNVPSLRFKPDPMDVNAMFFDHWLHHDPN